ncbi:hypothetical protein [Pedobacter chinensis]|uniref:hypothetical protein n=1 Tax=Pedobacter chinensis TaxID=2282421 RepID=UPI001314E6E9|nr:hypothetical protein [Pedobacter chinensis]
MTIQTYKATLKHGKGKATLTVVSLSGEQGAIQHITAVEGCPESAIVKLKMINSKKVQ